MKTIINKFLCILGMHDWDLKFYEGTLFSYEQCKRCEVKQAGWLR